MKRFLQKFGWLLGILFFLAVGIFCMIFPGFRFSGYLAMICIGILILYRLLRWLKKKKPRLARVLRSILTIGLCLVLVAGTVTGIVIGVAGKGQAETPTAYVIVLGAGVNGTQPSLILSERIERAYTYLVENPDAQCIVSGGQGPGEDITEARCMYDRLTARGIDGARIWMEDKSTSTRENLRFSLALIEEKTGQRPEQAAVISNEFHLYRAGLFAKEQGLSMVGVPAKTTWFSLRANYFLREIVAVWYYMILGG